MRSLKDLYKNHSGKVSDKWSIYLNEYEDKLRKYQELPIKFFEIGILNGGSLEIFSKYFTKAELILGLPAESKETFIQGLDNVLNSNAASVTIYTLMMLNGTEFKKPSYRKEFGYKGKFRIVPLNFGEYDGSRIFDYEEVGVITKDMSFDDYLYLRVIALFVQNYP